MTVLKRGQRGNKYIFIKFSVCFKEWVVNKTLGYYTDKTK